MGAQLNGPIILVRQTSLSLFADHVCLHHQNLMLGWCAFLVGPAVRSINSIADDTCVGSF